MKLNCNVNGNQLSIVVNSDKPLSQILQDIVDSFPVNSQCFGGLCGNCIVMINGKASLSCLVPAFSLSGASILTFEGYKKTRFYKDIERAYNDVGCQPCTQCYASKTLLIESILIKMEKENQKRKEFVSFGKRRSFSALQNQITGHSSGDIDVTQSLDGALVDPSFLTQELSLSKCQCIELSQLEKIVNLAYKYRSRRRARRT